MHDFAVLDMLNPPIPVIMLDFEWRYLYLNDRAERLVGQSRQELIGKAFADVCPLAIGSDVHRRLTETMYNKTTQHFEAQSPMLEHWVKYTTQPTPWGLVIYVQDIQEQTKQEVEEQTKSELFRQLLDCCPVGLLVVGKDNKILASNKAYIDSLPGQRKDQLALYGEDYKGIAEMMGENGNQSHLTRAMLAKQLTEQEYVFRKERCYLRQAAPLIARDGAVSGAVLLLQDITRYEEAREQYEQRLHKILQEHIIELEKLHLILELSQTGIVIVDQFGTLTAVSKWFFDKYLPKSTKAKFIGKHVEHFARALGLNYADTAVYNALRGEIVRNHYRRFRGNATLVSAEPLRGGADGRVTGAIAITYDISDYERLQGELVRLDRLNLIGEMAAGVAHEIRNPMTTIKGYLQFFKNKLPANLNSQLELILDELRRVELLVTDFLSLAKNRPYETEMKNLNEIIEEVSPLITADAACKGVNFSVNFDGKLPATCVNHKEIKQVILNLTRNGIEATPRLGSVSIVTRARPGKAIVTISDNGCGIPRKNLHKIFNPFYSTKENGTGLGLAVCASIIERHNGRITVTSKEGEGTKFIITLPVG